MFVQIDFDSNEAIYQQLCHQIILQIASETLQEGDSLPSVRDLANEIGINMHTVNKAYAILKEEGFLAVDRRNGAVVNIDYEKIRAMDELKNTLKLAVAKAKCKGITKEEVHELLDEICEDYEK